MTRERRRSHKLSVFVTAALSAAGLVAGIAAPAVAASTLAPRDLVYYVAYAGGVEQVFSMNSDGTGRKAITDSSTTSATKKCDPIASPSGGEVAFAANDEGMYVMDLQTRGVVNVAPKDMPDVGRSGGRRPAWSPDGNTLVFHYSLNWDGGAVDPAVTTFDLWLTHRVDGVWTPATRLTHLGPGQTAETARFANPNAADPGKRALTYSFNATPTAKATLYVIEDEAAQELTSATGPAGHPLLEGQDAFMSTWSADNSKIAYASGCSGAVKTIDVRYDAGAGWSTLAGTVQTIAPSSSCGLSFSRSASNWLTYAVNGRVYIKDVASTGKATSLGTGVMPSW
ncbi:MAG: hypothetical protein LC779_04620 [Actinobacteria bacterium]|nr:hypothetical protein [Actinomycetota bacterium]